MLIAAEALPYGSLYETNANAGHGPNFGGENIQYLTANGAEWNGRFWIALIQAMNSLGAPLDTVWGYELVAEQFYRDTSPPLNLGAGVVSTGNGQTYDMAVAGQKRLMMDENLVWWADQVRSAILVRRLDGTRRNGVPVAAGAEPSPRRRPTRRAGEAGDRLVHTRLRRHPSASRRRAHLPAVHGELRADDDAGREADRAGRVRRIQGRVPGRRGRRPEPEAASQAESCDYGLDGWLHWSWNTTEYGAGERALWNGDASGGVIDHGLGALLRPDPCAPVPTREHRAREARDGVRRQSRARPPTHAVDGLNATVVELGRLSEPMDRDRPRRAGLDRARIRLFVSQYPDGSTTHRILTRATTGDPWDASGPPLSGRQSTTRCSNTSLRVPGRTSATCASRPPRASPGSPGEKSSSTHRRSSAQPLGAASLDRVWSGAVTGAISFLAKNEPCGLQFCVRTRARRVEIPGFRASGALLAGCPVSRGNGACDPGLSASAGRARSRRRSSRPSPSMR